MAIFAMPHPRSCLPRACQDLCMQSRVPLTGVDFARGLARDAALTDAWRALWASRLLVWAAGVVAVSHSASPGARPTSTLAG